MAYASFRCPVDAPFLKVWQSVCETAQKTPALRAAIAIHNDRSQPSRQKLQISDLDLHEIVSVNPDKGEITLRLDGGQALQGERRFAVREDTSTSQLVIESSLNWQASTSEIDRRLHAMLELLVRDIALEMKTRSES